MLNSDPLKPNPPKLWIIGCGDVGWRLARRTELERTIWGFRRQPLRLLPNPNFQWFRLDLDQPISAFPEADGATVVYLAPPPGEGTTDTRMERFLSVAPTSIERLVYISTTAVYGDCLGQAVDEHQIPSPGTDRGRRRLHAEQLVQAFADTHDFSWSIARVPAIYGPQRLPIARLRSGVAIPDPKDTGPGNRIHVEDLVSALLLLIRHPKAHREIFNISDQNPIPTAEFLSEVAQQLNMPMPAIKPISELVDALSPQQQSFMGEQKVINANKITELLGFVPEFKDYREGISQSLKSTSHLKQLGE